jgi:putative colanic acid biosynthesis UDP-glucose lipid carrier transferase
LAVNSRSEEPLRNTGSLSFLQAPDMDESGPRQHRSHYPAHLSRRLLRNHDTLVQWIQHGLNTIAVVSTLLLLALWRDGEVGSHYRSMLVIAVLLMFITYHVSGVLRRFDSILGGIRHLARAWGIVVIILAWVAFLTKTSEVYSRQVVVYWAILSFMLQAFIFLVTYKIYGAYRTNHLERIPTLIVGTSGVAKHLARSLYNNIWLRDKVVGVINYGRDSDPWDLTEVPLLGTDTALLEVVKRERIRRIYVALSFSHIHLIKEIQDALLDTNVDLIWAPDIFELSLLNHSVKEVAGLPLIALNETPLMAGGPAFIKSLMDKIIALCALVFLSPLLIVVALLVKLSSPGPVIFKQVRDGWDGKIFHVYKFRSMYLHDEPELVLQAQKSDARVTPVGRFLRRTSIDELPQLLNVLQGTMSLVGPRPHAISHNQYYSKKVKTYLARHRIKPGMTGLAQIKGLRGETDTLEAMSKRVEYDLEYISNWSPLLDIKILLLTPFKLMSGNVY